MSILKRIITNLVTISMVMNLLTGCAIAPSINSSVAILTESLIEESFINETIYREQITQQKFIMEHLVYEDEIYECKVEEAILGEAYTIELVVSENTAAELGEMLPEELESYDIDWTKVIGKFAVGTSIIVVTGLIYRYLPKSTYFIFASPAKIAREAIIGAAFASVFEMGLKYVENGKLPSDAVKKHLIEGAADGYMWGAIYAVIEPFKVPKRLKLQNGEKLKIAFDGTVSNSIGEIVGKAYLGRKGIFILEETAGKTTAKLFSKKGKEIVAATMKQAVGITGSKLPPNTILQLASNSTAQICKTDANGLIYMVNGKLLPNVSYTLGNNTYTTDSLGRITKASFNRLEKSEIKRKGIAASIDEIGRGYQRPGDQRGHIIGDRFNGSNTLANMVPMSSNANQRDYRIIEERWSKAIDNGQTVKGELTFNYTNNSFRPDSFSVKYDIGNGWVEKLISNL